MIENALLYSVVGNLVLSLLVGMMSVHIYHTTIKGEEQ